MTAVAELEPEVTEHAEQEATPEVTPEAVHAEAPPADAPDCVREHYEQIRAKERDVRFLEEEYIAEKEAAADAKKDFERADKNLRDLIARGPDPQKLLPLGDPDLPKELPRPKRIKLLADVSEGASAGQEFDAILDANCEVSIAVEGLSEPVCLEAEEFEVIEWLQPEPPAEQPVNDAWRAAPITELGLTNKQNELFEEKHVKTIGQLEDLRAAIAEGKDVWPKGIGHAKITDIENRIVDWLDKNRDKFGEVAAEAA